MCQLFWQNAEYSKKKRRRTIIPLNKQGKQVHAAKKAPSKQFYEYYNHDKASAPQPARYFQHVITYFETTSSLFIYALYSSQRRLLVAVLPNRLLFAPYSFDSRSR